MLTSFTTVGCLFFILYLVGVLVDHQRVYGVQLKILESQLNKHSITGTLQNQYDYPVGGINVQAEFYNKEGELEPGEKSSYKIPDIGKSFPNTDFNVTAEGADYTNMVEVSSDELIGQINDGNRIIGFTTHISIKSIISNKHSLVNSA